MWSRLVLTMTCASQVMRTCTNRHYAISGHCTNTSFTKSCQCITPTSQRTNVGSPWPRSRPLFEQSMPYRSWCKSIHNSLPAPIGPMSSIPRLPPSTWVIRSSMSCRHPVLVSSRTKRTAAAATANGMAKHVMTTCPRSRSKLNSWVWSTASCTTTSKRSWTHIYRSLMNSNQWPWYANRSC